MKAVVAYAAAGLVGLGAAVFALWLMRSTPVGSDPALAGAAVAAAFAIVSGLLAAAAPRHWIGLALAVSLPLFALGAVMFGALAYVGEFFWVWLWMTLAGVAAALVGAGVGARSRRA